LLEFEVEVASEDVRWQTEDYLSKWKTADNTLSRMASIAEVEDVCQ